MLARGAILNKQQTLYADLSKGSLKGKCLNYLKLVHYYCHRLGRAAGKVSSGATAMDSRRMHVNLKKLQHVPCQQRTIDNDKYTFIMFLSSEVFWSNRTKLAFSPFGGSVVILMQFWSS